MNRSLIVILFLFLGISININAQSEMKDPVLFYVENEPVHVSEFKYIYEKNNRDSLRNTRESIEEYLNLYIKFKLKVHAAKDAGLDTVKALQDELNMYRKQLAKNYLLDREVEEAIAKTVFERQKEDLHVSHILIAVKDPQDTSQAFSKATHLLDSIQKFNKSFQEIAIRHSQDPGVKKNKGDLGYITAMFPPGFENFEHLAYNMEEGEVSGPVRSKAGYHLVKLHDKRAARGTVKIAHILVRKPDIMNDSRIAEAKDKIQDAYRALKSGMSWNQAIERYSEDKKSKSMGGLVGTFSIGVYEPSLEEVAYDLEKDGAYSEPVESTIGWHILKRIERTRPQDQQFEEVKKPLLVELEKTGRLETAQKALVNKIKKEAPFTLNEQVFIDFKENHLDQFTNYRWKAPEVDSPRVLLSFGDEVIKTEVDFHNFLKRNSRERMRLDRRMNDEQAAEHMLELFVDESALEYEQTSLEEKYPEFKNLMREYREGILLFEITKEKIWDRAPKDTLGLKEYYEAHKQDYMWNERAKVLNITTSPESKKVFERMTERLKKKGIQSVVEKYNKDTTLVTYTSRIIEKGNEDIAGIPWESESIFDIEQKEGVYSLQYVEEILPSAPKTLSEAKGFVISDYQSQLELDWIHYLEEKYRVKVEEEVLNELVQSYQ